MSVRTSFQLANNPPHNFFNLNFLGYSIKQICLILDKDYDDRLASQIIS